MKNKDKTLSEERCYNPDGKFWYYPEVKLAEAVKNLIKDYGYGVEKLKEQLEKYFGSFE